MKINLALIPVLLFTFAASGQSSSSETNPIMKVSDGFYHLFYDSSTAKSTIIEFDKFVALLEVPIKNQGGGATNLKDHSFGGLKVIAAIEKYFPKKPLKYVLHSHWHPHSISSVKPFLAKGVTLISTRTNLDRLKEFLDSATLVQYKKQIQFVDKDSLVIKDKTNSIIAYRFLQTEYKSTPANEYLYFYFPKYFALHSGCMYNKSSADPVDGREILTERQMDLNRFVTTKSLKIENFVRLSGDKHVPNCLQKGEDFRQLMKTGITSSELNRNYFSVETSTLNAKQDSIADMILTKKIPVSMLNGNVYSCLRLKDLERAHAFAKIQVLLSPSDPNAWDTLGEVNFFMGRKILADNYHNQSLKLDPSYASGGNDAWQKSLKEYEGIWNLNSR
jgi:hypothetical protein